MSRLQPACPRPFSARLSLRGITLPEVLTVLVLMAVLGAVAISAIADLLRTRQIKIASSDWARVVVAARDSAFHRHQGARLELQPGARGCLLVHTGQRGDCEGCGPAQQCRTGAAVLAATDPLADGLVATATNANLWWNPRERTVTPTSTLRIEAADGRSIHHVVNLAGRLRTCSPGGLVRGLAPC